MLSFWNLNIEEQKRTKTLVTRHLQSLRKSMTSQQGKILFFLKQLMLKFIWICIILTTHGVISKWLLKELKCKLTPQKCCFALIWRHFDSSSASKCHFDPTSESTKSKRHVRRVKMTLRIIMLKWLPLVKTALLNLQCTSVTNTTYLKAFDISCVEIFWVIVQTRVGGLFAISKHREELKIQGEGTSQTNQYFEGKSRRKLA